MSNNFSCFINVSNDSLSESAWMIERHQDFDDTGNGYAISAILILFLLLGLSWNIYIIYAIIKKRLYSQPIIMLMLNLAITNLLLCILVMPFNIVSGIAGEYVFGENDLVRCRVCQTGVMIITLPLVSIHTLALISIDRFIYLKRPLTYSSIVTPQYMTAVIVATWVLCVVISLPPLKGFGEIKFSPAVATCTVFLVGSTHVAPNHFYALLLLGEAVVPITTLVVLYVWIWCMIIRTMKQKKELNAVTEDNQMPKKRSTNQLCLVRFFVAIFTANLVTWLPTIILVLLGATLGAGGIPVPIQSISHLSYLSETVIHPMLQASHIQELKIGIHQTLAFFRRKAMAKSKVDITINMDLRTQV